VPSRGRGWAMKSASKRFHLSSPTFYLFCKLLIIKYIIVRKCISFL
jgi:hypothetical protein